MWPTGDLFEEWVHQWVKKLKKKIVIFVDNYMAHPQLINLRNIQLELLP